MKNKMLRTLMRNVNVLNVLLMAAIMLCALYILSPLLYPQAAFSLPSPKKTPESKEEKSAESPPGSPMEYIIIAEKNIFHQERKIPTDKPAGEAALPKPEFVLYGTLVAGDISLAYLEDQKASTAAQGKGKRQRAIKKGETMSGFTLKEIEEDKVVMVRGEEKIEVRVFGRGKQGKPATVAAPATSATSPQLQGRSARPRSSRPRAAVPSAE